MSFLALEFAILFLKVLNIDFSNIDFPKCRREIAAPLNDLSDRWCKRENVEPDALKEWKINIFKIINTRISFYSGNTHLLHLLWICCVFSVLCLLCLCAHLFICALWSPAWKGLPSWFSFVVSAVSLSLSHWYPGSGVVLDSIDS